MNWTNGGRVRLHNLLTPDEQAQIGRMLALPMRRKIQLAWRLRRDRRANRSAVLPLMLVIGYVLLPIHVIPRGIPFIRALDNLLVAAVGLWLFVKLMPPGLLHEHLARVERRR